MTLQQEYRCMLCLVQFLIVIDELQLVQFALESTNFIFINQDKSQHTIFETHP